jgi:hypothetical protein
VRLRIVACTLLLIIPFASTRAQKLQGLKEVRIVVEELDEEAKRAGLTPDKLESIALIALRRDLPSVKVVQTHADDWLYVRVSVIGQATGYVAAVETQLYRSVFIVQGDGKLSEWVSAAVWETSSLLTSSAVGTEQMIQNAMNNHLTKLIADYYKQNP